MSEAGNSDLLAGALEVAVRGFCFMRSFARPYVPERADGLWITRDVPRTASERRSPRKTEVFAAGLEPEEVAAVVRARVPEWHFVCHVHSPEDPFEPIRAGYKALGYRAVATEWVFDHALAEVPAFVSDPPVRRVRSLADALFLRTANRGRALIRPQDVLANDAPQRLFAVYDAEGAYGWVSSVPIGEQAWVANLYVPSEHRCRGFGRALMAEAMRDDRARGVRRSVLTASSDGARLYPHLGYVQIGTMQVFCPVRR